jgi:subtilisin family serine protease
MPRLLVALAAIAAVLGATVAGAIPADGATNDPYFGRQWGLERIQAEQAWQTSTGGGALIAIVDSGVDLGHPDLDGKIPASAGTEGDFIEPDGNCTGGGGNGNGKGKGSGKTKTCTQDGAQDENGHGTHVAGIAAAETGNGVGVAGTARGATLLPVRVLDESGSGSAEQVAAGIRYATQKGADVINLSLGFLSGVGTVVKVLGDLDPVYAAIDEAWAAGAVVVIAAGNDTFPMCAEPSAHPQVVCVGATDENDLPAFYTNSDATLSSTFLYGPGGGGLTCSGDIFSTYLRSASHSVCSPERGYEVLAGTSMATPFVSGVAALLAAQGLSNAAIVSCLASTADDLGVPGRDPVYGYGRVNAHRAVTSC